MQTTTAEKDWVNIIFLMLTPIIGVFGTAWYTIAYGFEWWMLVLGVVMYFLVGLSITAGYHRLFSHRTYEASRAVEFFHKAGSPTFDARVSARDNWAVALVTLGEGYHSFHHRFPSDFRNGIRWYQWDPSKWFIRGLQAAGQAWSLRRVPTPAIEHARMEAAVLSLEPRLAVVPRDRAEEIRQRINAAREEFARAIELWRRQAEERADGFSTAWKETRREAKRALAEAQRDWKRACAMLSAVPAHA